MKQKKKYFFIVFLIVIPTVCHEKHSALNNQKHNEHTNQKINPQKNMSMNMFAPHAWRDPNTLISLPPSLMNKQMGVVETIGVPPLGYKVDENVKVFELIAQPVEQFITCKKTADPFRMAMIQWEMQEEHVMITDQKIRAWGYNGHIPGPTIECTEGDRIRIVFKNELPEPTTIHWHGIELPWNQDGSGRPVMPGKTYTYEFTVYQSGTFIYHSGFNIAKQDQFGLAGLLVIHPKKYSTHIDRQFAIMLQAWTILPGSSSPDIMEMTDFNWFTFNGHSGPNIPVMIVNEGERVRIRFSNMSMDSHPIHIHGHTWLVVGTEGGPLDANAQWPGNTINVPPGTTRDVEFVAWNPGVWPFHCHKVHHTVNAHAKIKMGVMPHLGMFTNVVVVPKNLYARWKHPSIKGDASRTTPQLIDILPEPLITYTQQEEKKRQEKNDNNTSSVNLKLIKGSTSSDASTSSLRQCSAQAA